MLQTLLSQSNISVCTFNKFIGTNDDKNIKYNYVQVIRNSNEYCYVFNLVTIAVFSI